MLVSKKSVTLFYLASRSAHAFTIATQRRAFSPTTTALSATPPPPTQYMLTYDYIPDVLEKRGPYREQHLQLAADMAAAGTCLAGGPFGPLQPGGSPPTGALFVFDSADAAQEFVDKDPYVSGGIVTAHKIQAWTVAVSAKDA